MGPKGCGEEIYEISKSDEGSAFPVAEGENCQVLGPIKITPCRHSDAQSTVHMSPNSCKALPNPSQKALTNFSQRNMFLDPCKSILYPVLSVSCDCMKLPDSGGARSEPPGACWDPPSPGRIVSEKPGHGERYPGSGNKSSAAKAPSLNRSDSSNSDLNIGIGRVNPETTSPLGTDGSDVCVATLVKAPQDQSPRNSHQACSNDHRIPETASQARHLLGTSNPWKLWNSSGCKCCLTRPSR